MVPHPCFALSDTAGHPLPIHHTAHTLVYAHTLWVCVPVACVNSQTDFRLGFENTAVPWFLSSLRYYSLTSFTKSPSVPIKQWNSPGPWLYPSHSPWKVSAHPMASTTIWGPSICAQAQPVLWAPGWHVHCPISTSNLMSPKKNRKMSSSAKKNPKVLPTSDVIIGMTTNCRPLPSPLTLTLRPLPPYNQPHLSSLFYPSFPNIKSLLSLFPLPSPIPNTVHPQGPKRPLTSWHSFLGSSWLTRKGVYTVQSSPYRNPNTLFIDLTSSLDRKCLKGEDFVLYIFLPLYSRCFSAGNTNATVGGTIHNAGMSLAIQHI